MQLVGKKEKESERLTEKMAQFRSTSLVHGVFMVVAMLWCIRHAAVSTLSGTSSDSTVESSNCTDMISVADRRVLESLALRGRLSFDNTSGSAIDWGRLQTHDLAGPAAVVYPSCVEDVVAVVQAAARSDSQLTVAARGNAVSYGGQSQPLKGIAIEMSSMKGIEVYPAGDAASEGVPFVEASGGELWVDVLKTTLEYGLAPRSWTDYLYLTIGGTLSNAGVSGQTFRHGPVVSNVLQLQVVTGKGEVVECTPTKNGRVFFAVLGGLGQFGVITKARIVLEKAPQRVRWIRALYSDFATFTADQEALIRSKQPFDYVEGFVVVNDEKGLQSVPFRHGHDELHMAMIPVHAGSVMYCLELTKGVVHSDLHTLDQVVERMLAPLRFHRGLLFQTDTTYFKFLNRIHDLEIQMSAQGLWREIPHPWLNIFVPGSSIAEFDKQVFKPVVNRQFNGVILVYPVLKSKWDSRLSLAVPEVAGEEVFYVVALLRNKLKEGPTLEEMLEENEQIMRICEPLKCKRYLAHYGDRSKWERHFGVNWGTFLENKQLFDPCAILSPGLSIFARRADCSSSSSNIVDGFPTPVLVCPVDILSWIGRTDSSFSSTR